MHHLPSRGRRGSAAVLLAVAIALLLVAPAAAAGDLSLTPSQRTVTGSALTLVVTGGGAQGGVTLVVTDAAGSQAQYRFGAAEVADGRALTVDLSAPDGGAAPRNGRATVTLSDSTGTLAQAQVTVDRTPSTPMLSAAAEARLVRLTWTGAAAAGPVTYRLERSTGGTARVVYEGPSAAFTDRDLPPGRVAYALTAGVAGAGGGTNWSPPATTARIVALASPAASAADAAPAADVRRPAPATDASRPGRARQKAARATRQQRRRVAAAGIARPVGGGVDAVRTAGYASAPWLDASAVPHVVAAPPMVAAPRGSYPVERLPDPFPTRVLAAASLALPVPGAGFPPIVAAAGPLVLLVLAAAAVPRWRRERQMLQRLVTALSRDE